MASEAKELVFKFDGADVNSATFGRDFILLTNNVYELVEACSEGEVRILDVENNCIRYVVSAAFVACSILFGNGGSVVKDTTKYNSAAKSITAILKRRGSTLELMDSAGGAISRFDGQNGLPTIRDGLGEIKTTLAVYGELVDVGGAKPNIHIRSDAFDGDVVLSVEKEEAKELAKLLYSQVGVNASVTIRDGAVVSGKVIDVIDYTPIDLGKWLEDGVPGTEAFKGLNVAAFIAQQRG